MKGTGGKTGPVRTLILRSSLVEYMNQHFFLCFFFLVVFFCGQTDGVFDPLSPSPSPSSMSFISLCFLCDFFWRAGHDRMQKVVCVCVKMSLGVVIKIRYNSFFTEFVVLRVMFFFGVWVFYVQSAVFVIFFWCFFFLLLRWRMQKKSQWRLIGKSRKRNCQKNPFSADKEFAC